MKLNCDLIKLGFCHYNERSSPLTIKKECEHEKNYEEINWDKEIKESIFIRFLIV